MCTLRLNSQVQQYAGLTHGQRVLSRAPKLPVATVVNPNFKDSIYRDDAHVMQKQEVLAKLMVIQKRFYKAAFQTNPNYL